MRTSRFTALALAFGVGALGAVGADAAFAQEGQSPETQELERLLEELLTGKRAQPRAPKAQPKAKPVRPAPRPVQPKSLDPFEELLRRLQLDMRPLTPEERARQAKAMEKHQREFERRMADMDRRFADLRKRMDGDLRRMFGGKSPFGPGGLFGGGRLPVPNGGNSSRSFELGPNGVSKAKIVDGDTTIEGKRGAEGIFITVTKPGADGKLQTVEYRAKNEAEFKKKFPTQAGLYDRTFGRGRGFFVQFGTRGSKGRGLRPAVTPMPSRTVTSTKLGFSADPLSGMLRTQLRLAVGQGLYVKSVIPGGWAERAGLEPRDVIMQIGGAPVTGLADLEKVLSGKSDGDAEITLVLQRQGVRLELGVPK